MIRAIKSRVSQLLFRSNLSNFIINYIKWQDQFAGNPPTPQSNIYILLTSSHTTSKTNDLLSKRYYFPLVVYKSSSSFPNCLSRQNVQVDIFHNKKFSWPHYESFVRSRWMDTGFVLSRVFSHLEFLSIQNKKGLANAQPS